VNISDCQYSWRSVLIRVKNKKNNTYPSLSIAMNWWSARKWFQHSRQIQILSNFTLYNVSTLILMGILFLHLQRLKPINISFLLMTWPNFSEMLRCLQLALQTKQIKRTHKTRRSRFTAWLATLYIICDFRIFPFR